MVTSITHRYYKGYKIEEVDDGYSIDAIVEDEGYHFWKTIDTASTLDEAISKIDRAATQE